VVGFIAGETAPKGRTMGHAGAIVSGADESAAAKKKVMRECGIHVVDSPATIGAKVKEVVLGGTDAPVETNMRAEQIPGTDRVDRLGIPHPGRAFQ
jgi:hypothetical protein